MRPVMSPSVEFISFTEKVVRFFLSYWGCRSHWNSEIKNIGHHAPLRENEHFFHCRACSKEFSVGSAQAGKWAPNCNWSQVIPQIIPRLDLIPLRKVWNGPMKSLWIDSRYFLNTLARWWKDKYLWHKSSSKKHLTHCAKQYIDMFQMHINNFV